MRHLFQIENYDWYRFHVLVYLLIIFSLPGFSQEKTKFSPYDYFRESKFLDSMVEARFSLMNDTQRVSQMIIQACGGLGRSKKEMGDLIGEQIIGGAIFLKSEKKQVKDYIRYFDSIGVASNQLPLIYTTDGEPSLINNKIKGLKTFPKTNTLATPAQNTETGIEIASVLKESGITYNYAPVCDMAVNKEIINNRSYGNDKSTLIPNCKAFARALQMSGVAATAKHFPGHGNVKGDSHINLVCIDGEMQELDIFREMVADSVISVMVGHIAIKNNEKYNTGGLPSSCSEKIVTGLLREELNFKGIIITDGMNMGALGKVKNPSMKAVQAGCDIILIPENERKLSSDILSEMHTDEKFKGQVYNSVKRVIRLKVCLGLI